MLDKRSRDNYKEGGDGYGLLYKLSLIDVLELICFYQIDLTMVLPVYTIHVHEAGGDSIMYVCLLIMLLSIASLIQFVCTDTTLLMTMHSLHYRIS